MNILVSNDDGIDSRGLHTLVQALVNVPGVVVYVSAPDGQRSAASHCITMREPILFNETEVEGAAYAEKLTGSPADCVKSGLKRLARDREVEFDAVFTGINHGPNVGDDVFYSGTIGAAAEGVFAGIPAVAVSVGSINPSEAQLENTKKLIGEIVEKIVPEMEKYTLLNVNFPPCEPEEIKGLKVTKLGPKGYDEEFKVQTNPRGQKYFWYAGTMKWYEGLPDDLDTMGFQENYITISPMRLNLTDESQLDKLKNITLDYR